MCNIYKYYCIAYLHVLNPSYVVLMEKYHLRPDRYAAYNFVSTKCDLTCGSLLIDYTL
jgi:hypothetical protein